MQNGEKVLLFYSKYGNIVKINNRKVVQMNYNKELLDNNQVKITVEASAEEWSNAISEAYNKTKGRYNIEGFRKGKAPKKVIESYYGVGVFFEPALDIIVPKLYNDILDKETELRPVAQPDVDIVAISDAEVKLKYTVTTYPDVKLGAYKGLKIEAAEYIVSDADVDAELDKARERAAATKNVDDRAAAMGDTVVIDFCGSIDGVKFEGGTAEGHSLELGSRSFIPGFEEQVVGVSIGEEKDVAVKFPDDYGVEELNGKEAVFAIKLHEIKTKIMPEVNDEFAKDVSEFDTLAEYKASIVTKLEEQNKAKTDREIEDAVINAVVEKAEVNIPDVMIEQQIEEMIREFEYRLQYQGMNIDDYYKYTNTSKDVLATQYRERAQKNVLTRVVMSEIIKVENIEPTDAEIDAKVADYAKGANKEVEEYKKTMSEQQINYIVNDVVMDKLFAMLKSGNEISLKKA